MTIIYDRIIEGNVHLIKAAGLSTEDPPVGVADGSQYWQVDAGIIQMFDATNQTWHNFAKFDTGSETVSTAAASPSLSMLHGSFTPALDSPTVEPVDGESE